jgi:signal transduction histidine kinase
MLRNKTPAASRSPLPRPRKPVKVATHNLFVRDTGIGIKAEDQPGIFDRFYRAGRPQNGAHRGSGLGLAFATWIAEKHQTKINVTSESGRGSCLSIGLPALPAEADPRFRPRTSNLPTVQTQEEA